MHLSAMVVAKVGSRFQFDDDLTVADEVRLVLLLQRPAFVG
jgi:hypothetical protein